jgi:hypothetical protein
MNFVNLPASAEERVQRKSMKAKERERLSAIIEKLGYEVLKESDIRDLDGVPWQFCRQLRQKAKEVCKSVVVDGKTINPDMVYETNKKIIKLSYD